MATSIGDFINCYNSMSKLQADARLVLNSEGKIAHGAADAGLFGRKTSVAQDGKSQLAQNNEIRTALLSALNETFSNKIPDSVRKALRGSGTFGGSDMSKDSEGNVNSGRPLTMRRIRAVLKAVSDEKAKEVTQSMIREKVSSHVDGFLEKFGVGEIFNKEVMDAFVDRCTDIAAEKFKGDVGSNAFLNAPMDFLGKFVDSQFKNIGSELYKLDNTLRGLCECVKKRENDIVVKDDSFTNFLWRSLEVCASGNGMRFLYGLAQTRPEALESIDTLREEVASRVSGGFEDKEDVVERIMNNPSILDDYFNSSEAFDANMRVHDNAINSYILEITGERPDLDKSSNFMSLLRRQLILMMNERQTTDLPAKDVCNAAAHAYRLARICDATSYETSDIMTSFHVVDYSAMDRDAFLKMIGDDIDVGKRRDAAVSHAKGMITDLIRELNADCLKLVNSEDDGNPPKADCIVNNMMKWINGQSCEGLSDEKVRVRFNSKFGKPFLAISSSIAKLLPGDDRKALRADIVAHVLNDDFPRCNGIEKVIEANVKAIEEDEGVRYIFNPPEPPDVKKLRDALVKLGETLDSNVVKILGPLNKNEDLGAQEVGPTSSLAMRIYMERNNVSLPNWIKDDDITGKMANNQYASSVTTVLVDQMPADEQAHIL